jgi:hypothetical protein
MNARPKEIHTYSICDSQVIDLPTKVIKTDILRREMVETPLLCNNPIFMKEETKSSKSHWLNFNSEMPGQTPWIDIMLSGKSTIPAFPLVS